MKKVLIWILILIAGTVSLIIVSGVVIHEPRPIINPSAAADSTARIMLESVNKKAWDTTRFVQWKIMDHFYFWDKYRNFVRIRWGNKQVYLDTRARNGQAFIGNKTLSGNKRAHILLQGWRIFCIDSFWLNGVVRAFDPGTVRSLVKTQDGRMGLMVTCESGFIIPGDSYLWLLDSTGKPESLKMWIRGFPVGGIEVNWQGWEKLRGGVRIATEHKVGPVSLGTTTLKTGKTWSEFGYVEDPFANLALSRQTGNAGPYQGPR